MNYFVPFLKVDILSDDEAIVSGIATDETPDSDGEITDYYATKEAAIEYSNWRNIREMHSPSAVGVAEEINLDDLTRSMVITARVIGKEVVKKVRAGVYKGFSIGGKKLAPPVIENRAGQMVKRITKYMLTEISLVDRPANPSAVFTMVKREKEVDMKDQLRKWLDVVKAMGGGESVAKEMEETIAKMDEEIPPKEENEDTAKADGEMPSDNDGDEAGQGNSDMDGDEAPPAEKSDEGGEPTQAPPDESIDQLTAESVRDIVMNVLLDVGLVRQMAGGGSSMAFSAEIGDLKKSLALYASANDFQKAIGDLALVVNAVETINTRLETIEKSSSQMGPVLRELGPFGLAGIETSVLEKMLSETTDPLTKQQLGLQLAQAQIRNAQGTQINFK